MDRRNVLQGEEAIMKANALRAEKADKGDSRLVCFYDYLKNTINDTARLTEELATSVNLLSGFVPESSKQLSESAPQNHLDAIELQISKLDQINSMYNDLICHLKKLV